VLAVTDAAVLLPLVDGVIFVIKPGSTKVSAVRQSIEHFRRTGANILGIVLNDVRKTRSRYHYYYTQHG
jgi:Mrp family chromosome partitioning ATPase